MQLSELDAISKREYKDKIRRHKLKFKPDVGLSKDMRFGVEIEFRGFGFDEFLTNSDATTAGDLAYSTWCLDYDDSLPLKTGRELISPILRDRKEDWQSLKDILESLNENVSHLKVDDKCSNHIHFSADWFDKDPELLFSFMVLLAEMEPVLTRFFNGEFLNLRYYADEYARPFTELFLNSMPDSSSYLKLLKSFYEDDSIMPSAFYKMYAFDFSRMYMNTNPLFSKEIDTIENRLPNGTLSPIIIQNNVMLFGYLLMHASSYDYERGIHNIKDFDRRNLTIDDDMAFLLADIFPSEDLKLDFLKQYYKDETVYGGVQLKKSLDFF